MAVDISGLSYFLPIAGFLFVFVVMYAILAKVKILGDSKPINVFVSLIIAVIFSTFSSVQEYVQTVTPWFVVLIIALFFIMMLVGFGPGKYEIILTKGFTWFLIIVLIAMFLTSAIVVFSSFSSVWDQVTDFVTNEARIAGGLILLIVAALAAWVITRK